MATIEQNYSLRYAAPPWASERPTALYTGDVANYPVTPLPHPDWAYVTPAHTTCPYCGGTFGADDVRCRGCGADVRNAA